MIPRPMRANLPEQVSDLLIALSHGYFVGAPMRFAPLSSGDWDGHSLADYEGTISFADSALRLTIQTSGTALPALHNMMSLRNKPVKIALRDGSTVSAEVAHMTSLGEEADVKLYHWIWGTQRVPTFWLARLEGKLPSFGNLSLSERGDGWFKARTDGYRFEGHYVWYVLPTASPGIHDVVLDAGGKLLDRAALINDFLALQLTLGGGLRINYFTGLDGFRNAVAAISLSGFERPNSNYRPPVPHRLDEAQIWLPEFFKLVAAKLAMDGLEPLIIPIAAYLDAESDHLDGGYLKAQVGLEAFANRLTSNEPKELLVQDEKAWKRWISSLKNDIRPHLKDPKKLDAIVGKFIVAMFASSGDRVARALSAHGVSLPDEVHNEIRKRNYPAHGFFMNKTAEHDIDVDARRLELIQTVLAALVAVHVGYEGPLHGYEVAPDGGRLPPDWWQVRTTTQAVWTRYFGERYVARPHPRSLQGRSPMHEGVNHDHERIVRERAYFLWLNRTGTAWWDQASNWLEAEQMETTRTG